MVLGGWFVLWRPKTRQIPVHSCPTNPKGCSTTVPGHPCSVTCPQPAQEKDLGEETTANPWFGCVTQVAQPRGGISRDLLGVQLPTRPSWDILCHSAKANLSLLCVSTLPARNGEKIPSFCPIIENFMELTSSCYYYSCLWLTTALMH